MEALSVDLKFRREKMEQILLDLVLPHEKVRLLGITSGNQPWELLLRILEHGATEKIINAGLSIAFFV